MSEKSFSCVFWDLIFIATGFKRHEIDCLRDGPDPRTGTCVSDRDVSEPTISDDSYDDVEWAHPDAISTLRSNLANYLNTLRALKAENVKRQERTHHVKNFVEDSRYKVLREREMAQRVTTQSVVKNFSSLNLSGFDIDIITQDLSEFSQLTELNIGGNNLSFFSTWPPNLSLLSAASNKIEKVVVPSICSSVLYLSFAGNNLQDISFIKNLPQLSVADFTFNCISDLPDVISTLQQHPAISEVALHGNPVGFAEGYRFSIVNRAPNITILDDAPVTDHERLQMVPVDGVTLSSTEVKVTLQIVSVKNLQFGMPPRMEEDNSLQNAQNTQKNPKKDAKKVAKVPSNKTAEEPNAPPVSKRTFSVKGTWCNFPISVDDVEGNGGASIDGNDEPSIPTQAVSVKAKPAPKAGKGQTQFEPEPQKPSGHIFEFELPVTPNLGRQLLEPLLLHLGINDLKVVPDSPPEVDAFELGNFVVDLSPIAKAVAPYKDTFTLNTTAPLRLCSGLLAKKRNGISKMKAAHSKAIENDETLDRILADALKSPSPQQSAAEADKIPAGGKKGNPAKSTAASKHPVQSSPGITEEVAAMKEESAQRKIDLEESSARIVAEERILQRLIQCEGIELVVNCMLASNFFPVKIEAQPTAPVDAQPAAPAKGKKK